MKTKISPERMADVVLQDWLEASTMPPHRSADYMRRFFAGYTYANVLAAIREAAKLGYIEDTAWRGNLRNWEPSKSYLAICLKAERMAFARLKQELPLASGVRREPAAA